MANERAEAGPLARSEATRLSTVGLCALVLATTALRFTVGRDLPLWLDETWTAMIASRPTAPALFHELHQDVNGPLYYLVAWAAAPVTGLSNAGLRVPAAIFGSLAPLLCLTLPDQRTGRLWCAISALWVAGLVYSEEARCFTLLWALSTAATVVFVRLLSRPDRGTACLWVGLASLAVLTHYFAAFLFVAQAAVLIYRQRASALRLWPAAAFAAPALAWLAFHAPRIAEFGSIGDSWYPRLSFWTAVNLSRELAGSDILAAMVLLLALVLPWRRAGAPAPGTSPEHDAGLAAALGLALVLLVDALHPSLTARYLFALAPGLLLWLCVLALRPDREIRMAPMLLIGAFAVSAALWAATRPTPLSRNFSWEEPSAWIMERHPSRLVFLWDNPSTPIIWPESMAAAGGFFFERAGRALPVRAETMPGADPNETLRRLPPDVAILWVYDTNVKGTKAVAHPPDLASPGRECRGFGRWWMNVQACRPTARN